MADIIDFGNFHRPVKKVNDKQLAFANKVTSSFLDIDLETQAARFLQPGVTNLYRRDTNPVKCWYLELKHVMDFYDDSVKHRWIIDTFQNNHQFRTDIQSACEIDMYNIYKNCEYWANIAIDQKLHIDGLYQAPKRFMKELEKWRNKFRVAPLWLPEHALTVY